MTLTVGLFLAAAALAGGFYYAHKNPDRTGMAVRWLKDHAPTFTVSFVTFTALWIAVVLACITLYVWDSQFYRAQAPEGMELTFMTAGIVFRTFVIFGGLCIIWIKQSAPKRSIEDATAFFGVIKYKRYIGSDFFGRSAQTLRFIWLMGLVACGVAALGFVTEGHDFHYRKTAAITQTETATTDSADSIIARATAEKESIRKDRDGLVAAARQSMNLVLDDGNAKNDDVSQYEANIAKYQTDAEAKLAIQDAIIAKAEGERLTAKQSATEKSVGDPGLPAVYRAPSRYIAGFDGVTFRDLFGVFWVILLEACGSVGAQSLLAVQMALSKRKALQAAGAKGGNTTERRRRVREKRKLIEDYSKEKAAPTTADLHADDDDGEDDDLLEGGPDNAPNGGFTETEVDLTGEDDDVDSPGDPQKSN